MGSALNEPVQTGDNTLAVLTRSPYPEIRQWGLFTAHHVVSLRAHAGWDVTALGSTGCFLGGLIWSWLYLRYRSIWPCYISHIFADVAIYIIGWVIIFGQAGVG